MPLGSLPSSGPLAPRKNYEAMRSRLTPHTPTTIAPLSGTKPAFQLARPPPDLSSMKQGNSVKVPHPSAPSLRAHPSHQPSPTSAPPRMAHPSSSNAHTSQATAASSPAKYNPKLDQLPMEKLRTMLCFNQDEKMSLMETKMRLMEGDEDEDLLGEDMDMIQGKIKLLTARIAELKNAIAARSGAPSSSNTTGSDTGTPTHKSRRHPMPMSNVDPVQPPPRPPTLDPPYPSANAYAAQPESGPSRPRTLVPNSSPPPEFDEMDIAMAEHDDWDEPPEDMIPQTPPRRTAPLRKTSSGVVADRDSAIAEFANLDVNVLDSSPIKSPERPIRAEASASRPVPRAARRSSPIGPMPSQVARREPPPPPAATVKAEKWDKDVERKLRHLFGLPRFRHNQREAVNATLAGKDVFVLMPTGGGKSLTYQLPAVCSGGKTRGVTFVVSPLISLINDQTRHLIHRRIPAIAYTGDMTAKDKQKAHAELACPEPNTKVVYITPEMLSMGGHIKGILRDLLRRKRLARFVIDEAHCVSAWGHDFRSDYLKLDQIKTDYPGVPIMALTATAPNKVQEDIIRVLGLNNCTVLKQSFNRPNLHYEVRPKLKQVMNDIAGFIGTQQPGASGIIYCSSREKCENLAKELRENHNIQAWHYHAGMSKGDRRKVQEGWQDHKFDVIVATVAFGMGIDKPDVRYVIHHTLPRSLEGYYQETGRAGRDGGQSSCILFFSYADSKAIMQLTERDTNLSPEQKNRQKDNIREVLRFCINKTDCRRSQVLAFFNETFNPAACNQSCDVCSSRDQKQITVKDVTEDAKRVLQMIKAFGRGDKITVLNAVDCFRGTNGNSAKGLGGNPLFACGKDWDRTEAERLVQNLLIERALDEFYTANGAGWTNSYLQLGPQAHPYLSCQKTLKMDFREASPNKSRASTSGGRKSTGETSKAARDRLVPLAQRKPTKSTTALSRKRSRQEVLEEEQEFVSSDGDFEPIEDDTDDGGGDSGRVASAPSKRLRRSTSKSASEQCLEALRKLRDKKALPLSIETLETIAAMMPQNMPKLAQVEGLTEKQAKTYGSKILGVTMKYVNDHRAQEAPNAPIPAAIKTALTGRATTGRPAAGSSGSGLRRTNLAAYTFVEKSAEAVATVRRVSLSTAGRLALAQPGSSRPRF